ncbi:MAG: DUF5721 family protein, partial [Niameybacter sp.]
MNKLIKSDLFDSFLIREAILHTAFKSILDGHRNMEFYNSDEREDLSDYLTWGEIRPYIYQIIIGSKSPSYFKIILSTNKQKTEAISDLVDTCFINITFKASEITVSTGIAYKTFTLDKSPETIWDTKIKNFL